MNPFASRWAGADNELNAYKDFGLHCISLNDLRRDDTQGVTGSSPVRPTNFFLISLGFSNYFDLS
jgi:hypothetical protein